MVIIEEYEEYGPPRTASERGADRRRHLAVGLLAAGVGATCTVVAGALGLAVLSILASSLVGAGLAFITNALLNPMGRKALPENSQSTAGSLHPVNNQAALRGAAYEDTDG